MKVNKIYIVRLEFNLLSVWFGWSNYQDLVWNLVLHSCNHIPENI